MALPHIELVGEKIVTLQDREQANLLCKCLRDSTAMPEEGPPMSVAELLTFYDLDGQRLLDMGIVLTKPLAKVVLEQAGRTINQPTINAKFTGPNYYRFFQRDLTKIGGMNVITIAECFLWFDGRVPIQLPQSVVELMGG